MTVPTLVPHRPVVTARVAVIVPAFEAEAYLAETLQSMLDQTFAAWECVVVDDGSTDGTAAVAEGFCARDRRFRLVRQQNAGVSAARNAGLDAVSTGVALVAFLDSDDAWLPDTLAVLVAAIEERGDDTVGVYGLAEYMDADGHAVHPGAHPAGQRDRRRLGRFDLVGVPSEEPSTWSSLIVSGTIWPSGVALHRRAAVESAGRFDPEQRYMEDWDLYLRMSRTGAFRPVQRQVVRYRRHATNLTDHAEQMAYFGARLRWKTTTAADSTAAQDREARRVWRRLQLRWVVWSAGAAVAGARSRDHAQLRDAVHALGVFGRQLAAGRPAEPDVETARLIARFVTPRSQGRGAIDG